MLFNRTNELNKSLLTLINGFKEAGFKPIELPLTDECHSCLKDDTTCPWCPLCNMCLYADCGFDYAYILKEMEKRENPENLKYLRMNILLNLLTKHTNDNGTLIPSYLLSLYAKSQNIAPKTAIHFLRKRGVIQPASYMFHDGSKLFCKDAIVADSVNKRLNLDTVIVSNNINETIKTFGSNGYITHYYVNTNKCYKALKANIKKVNKNNNY